MSTLHLLNPRATDRLEQAFAYVHALGRTCDEIARNRNPRLIDDLLALLQLAPQTISKILTTKEEHLDRRGC